MKQNRITPVLKNIYIPKLITNSSLPNEYTQNVIEPVVDDK